MVQYVFLVIKIGIFCDLSQKYYLGIMRQLSDKFLLLRISTLHELRRSQKSQMLVRTPLQLFFKYFSFQVNYLFIKRNQAHFFSNEEFKGLSTIRPLPLYV